jgi:hypothetical protein
MALAERKIRIIEMIRLMKKNFGQKREASEIAKIAGGIKNTKKK